MALANDFSPNIQILVIPLLACALPAALMWFCLQVNRLVDRKDAEGRIRASEADIRESDARVARCRAEIAERATRCLLQQQPIDLHACGVILNLDSTAISPPRNPPVTANLTIGASVNK